ncbi:MAG: hypothetical protein UT32_C0005G0032 [Parcubacteria group bacterium GW2011_GWC2_39_14]|nr:MAG: hypothetical protein UT32_C0005G0032 [Parcubacteria group bacterium GW2011_GWC2_39_14]KKR54614.1 MAG: hypothetical protein UT91_C0012G0033 [Parcubacteria group bacterium GW2011_GWA2_40_23]
MTKPDKIIDVNTNENLEQIEEDIIEAADKAGKKNIIVNIFSAPREKLKRRWEVRYKFNKKHLVMDILIALGVLFLIGLNIFWAYGGFHYFFNRLDFSAQLTNEKVVSGATSEIVVQYNNRNKFEIEEAVLSLTFPKYFVLESVDRENYDALNNILVLGDLAPGANGKIVITGKIYGNIDEKQAVFGAINYFKTDKKDARLWGQFRNNMILEYSINDSLLMIEASLPDKLVRGQVFDMPVKIINRSDNITYKKLLLTPVIDEQVKFVEFKGKEINNLEPGAISEFKIKVMINTDKTEKNVGLSLAWIAPEWNLIQAQWQKNQFVVDQKFTLTQKVLNTKTVNPGEWVDFVLNYENAGTFTIENAKLSLQLMGDYWDLSNLKKANGLVSQNYVVWTENEIPRLALIQPGEKGEIKLSIKTKAYVSGSSDFDLKSITVLNDLFEGNVVTITSDPLTTRLNSNLAVQAYPMYYAATGDQLGRGSLPPKVGESTKYWVFARLINDISPVEKVTLTMELPLNVSWSDKTSVAVGDPLVYDPNTRTVSWTVSKLPVKPTNIGLAFEVSIIPTASQVGQNPVLIQNIKISGKDERTGALIEKELGNITTKLIQDTKGKLRDGVVR